MRLNPTPPALDADDEPLFVVRVDDPLLDPALAERRHLRAAAEQAAATLRALGLVPEVVAAEHADGELCEPVAACPADECEQHAVVEAALDADADAWADR